MSSSQEPALDSREVLLVDDEPSVTKLMSRVLTGGGWLTTIESSPLRALELVRAAPSRFRLIITDMSMPGMSGVELAVQLKLIAPQVPIVLSTGGGETAGHLFVATLPKPFELSSLLQTVNRATGRG